MKPPSPLLIHALRRLSRVRRSSPAAARSGSTFSPRHSSSSSNVSSSSPHGPKSAASMAPRSTDRGPPSTESTQTDFSTMNVLGNLAPPSTAIEMCLPDGFSLDNGIEISRGNGVLLVQGEAFGWRPWEAAPTSVTHTQMQPARTGMPRPDSMLNAKGQWEVDDLAWGLLDCVWPKPELLILGLGASMHPLSPKTKHRINSLGIRLDIQDTRNAAAQFNLLATERGVSTVAAALLPVGWKGKRQ